MPGTLAKVGIGAIILIAIIVVYMLFLYDPLAQYELNNANSMSTGVEMPMGGALTNGTSGVTLQADGHLVTYTNIDTPTQVPADFTGVFGSAIAARVPVLLVTNTGSLQVRSKLDGGIIWEGPQKGPSGVWILKVNPNASLAMIDAAGNSYPYFLK